MGPSLKPTEHFDDASGHVPAWHQPADPVVKYSSMPIEAEAGDQVKHPCALNCWTKGVQTFA